MNTSRVLLILLVANLLATLLVYRDVAQLREQTDRPRIAAVPAGNPAPARDGPRSQPQTKSDSAHAPAMEHADSAGPGQRRDPAPDAPGAAPENDDLQDIKERFSTEYVDAAWTGQVQQAIRNAAGGAAAYAEISQGLVECRERICRLELGYGDPAVFDAFIGDLTAALKGEPSSLYFAEPDSRGGYATVEVYLVRE